MICAAWWVFDGVVLQSVELHRVDSKSNSFGLAAIATAIANVNHFVEIGYPLASLFLGELQCVAIIDVDGATIDVSAGFVEHFFVEFKR